MALIKDLYRHERTKYWFGFGGPKKDELKKQRNTRHTVLKSCLPLSALLCFAKLMVSVFSWAMTENADVCLNYPSDDHFRSRFRAVLGVQVPCMVLAALQAWNFLIVWHRKNHSIRRSLLVAAGDSVLIILSAVNVSLVESMRAAAPSAEDIIEEFPDLERDHRATYLERRLTRSFPSQSIAFLSLVCVDVAIHVSAMAFWHWLLPPVWRFPEHYEPVIREGKGKKDVFEMVRGSSSQVELVEQQSTEASNDQTSLAALFWEQEGKKLRANSRQSAENVTQKDGSNSARTPLLSKQGRPGSRGGSGPRFAPQVQYWASGTMLFNYIMRPLSAWTLFCFIAESVSYILIRSYELRCRWYCHLAFGWILLVTLLLATVITLVRFRGPFDYKLGGKLRIDLVLMAVEILLSIVGFATHVYRLIDRSSRESTSSQSIKDNPRIYQPYMASNALGFIVSISWSFFTGLGIFVLPLTVWKHWKRRSVRNLG